MRSEVASAEALSNDLLNAMAAQTAKPGQHAKPGPSPPACYKHSLQRAPADKKTAQWKNPAQAMPGLTQQVGMFSPPSPAHQASMLLSCGFNRCFVSAWRWVGMDSEAFVGCMLSRCFGAD